MAETKIQDVDHVFDVWQESEKVAMHFNDLIMRWRLQAIGGLAALVTLIGFVSKDVSDPGIVIAGSSF